MAASSKTVSSSSARQWKYDVFLSFRGPDTRRSITSEIHNGLQNRRGIKTFMDDQDLDVGDPISPSLLTAIEESRFAIVVLSPHYASSTWCLEELAKICECMEDNNRILPLFYNVKPTEVRYQKTTFEDENSGVKSTDVRSEKKTTTFEDAFTKHRNSGRYEPEKMQQWTNALNKVASFSGWNSDNFKTDRELVDTIVATVCTKVPPTTIESTEGFTVFGATRDAMDQIMQALKDNTVTAIGVYGMGGVGKTTLVEHVGHEARKQGLFDQVIKVRVTQNPITKNIQGTLADALGIKLIQETEDGRVSRLSAEIMRRNKLLIILDNVWEKIDLSKTGIPTYEMLRSRNSKVLLTTRIKNVCHVMRSQESITLKSLSKKDSWTLFVKNARESFESIYFEEVARRVASECGGLPTALIAVARALGDKDLKDWEQAALRLEMSQAANLDDSGDASECIKLSYGHLKDKDSKSCFLLCCLFPGDYDIPIQDLFKYGIGIGLFEEADTIQQAREKASLVAKHLKASSLLLDSEFDGCVKMHDVIRDTAIQITQSGDEHKFLVNAGCSVKNWPRRLREGYSAISLMKNNIRKLPKELVCPKLQLLLLQENDDLDYFPDTFFKDTSLLRVVDLSYTSISSLSKSFIHLSNLQGLYLDSCQKINDISILKNCEKLEILSMKDYPLEILSKDIGNLTSLRLLDVSDQGSVGGGIVSIPSGVISELDNLEELCLLCGFWDWGSEVEGEGEVTNAQFDEVTSLPYLSSLKVRISDANCLPEHINVYPSWTNFEIYIGRDRSTRNIIKDLHGQVSQYDHKYSRSLVLDTTISRLPAWFVEVVTKNTEKLMYVNFTGVNNIRLEYQKGKLHSLKHLSVIGPNESLEELIRMDISITTMILNNPVLERLEELHLESMESLTELCVGELPSRSLYSLKVLKVCGCPKLGNVLLPSKLLQRLVNLENLFCKSMAGMEYVFECEGLKLEQSKLREVTLLELDAVKGICNGLAPPAMFQALKSLFISRCKFVGALFTFDVAQCLFQVEDIFIKSCPTLERLVEASKESELSKKTVLPKLTSLVLVDLPMLYSGSAAVDMECPSLQQLYVRDCPHFPASSYDLGSNNQVKLNDPQHYVHQQSTRLGKAYYPSAWNTPTSIFEGMQKIRTSVNNELLQSYWPEMSDLMERPNVMNVIADISTAIPEVMENVPKLLEKVPRPIVKKMPELVEKTPDFFEAFLGAMERIAEVWNKTEPTRPETISFESNRIAVVTGANIGIGLEISRQLASNGVGVVLTATDVKTGTEAVEKLKASGFSDVVFHQLDVNNQTTIASLADFLKSRFGKLDILVNNAGVVGSTYVINNVIVEHKDSLGSASLKGVLVQTYETAEDCLKTNYYGTKRLTEALLPLLQKSEAARIVNVSSSLGQLRGIENEKARKALGDVDNLTEEKVDKLVEEFLEDVKQDLIESKGWPLNISSFIVSKAALNAYTRILAKKYPEIATNAVCPGFTSAGFNQNTGVNTVEEAAEGPVKLALGADTKISGLFFKLIEESTFE